MCSGGQVYALPCSSQWGALSFELHQGLTCSPTRKVTPTQRSGHSSLWLTEHLTCLATWVSLSTTTWLAIIPSESALFHYLLFLLRGWIYEWINPAAYFFGGFWPVLWCFSIPFFCSVIVFFLGVLLFIQSMVFPQAYYLMKILKIIFL